MQFCLRYAIPIQDINELIKVTLVQASEDELRRRGEVPNVSRISAMTGLHRRDVTRIFQNRDIVEEPQGLLTKIIGQWQQDRRFSSEPGKARVLEVDGPDSEFRRLCWAVSSDLNPGTVLLELERLGSVVRTKGGVKLVTKNYVPKGNLKEALFLLSRDMQVLFTAVHENIVSSSGTPNLHGTTEYDNIPPHYEPKIREWLLKQGGMFHRKVSKFLSQFDRDTSAKVPREGGSIRVSVGTVGLVARNDKD